MRERTKDPAVEAVRRVLYEPKRLRALSDHLSSIRVLMNLDPRVQLQPGDARVAAGSGPAWFVPATGAVDPGVLEAADRCDRVADLLLRMRLELGPVRCPAADKRRLRSALAEQAKAWRARGRLWRTQAPPPDPEAAAASIVAHERASLAALQQSHRYLKRVDARLAP